MLSFDSFPEQLQQHQWVPMVQRLVEASDTSSGLLADLLEPMPNVGHYRLIALIGHGGMARVFAAWDERTNHPVAIKLFEPKHEEVWSLIQRFQNEAKAIGRMEHPHIVSLLDRGNKKGRVYFVMNLIVGSSLSELYAYWKRGLQGEVDSRARPSTSRLSGSAVQSDSAYVNISLSSSATQTGSLAFRDSNGAMLESVEARSEVSSCTSVAPSMIPQLIRDVEPFSEEHFAIVINIGRDVCDALRYSHEKGVLHRDIKPSNLLLDEDGKSWVMDFGLASLNWRSGGAVEERLTRHGDLLGTIAYMSVGAVEGEYSEQSDLYSLGATLYELTTLRPIWQGCSEGDILKQLFDRSPPPIDHLHGSQVPVDLSRLIDCLLNSETSLAKPTAEKMHCAFESLALGELIELPSGPYGIKLRTRHLMNRWFKPKELFARMAIWLVVVLAFATVMGYKLYSEHRVLATEAASIQGLLQRRVDQTVYSVQLLKQFAETVEEFQPDNFASFAGPVLENNPEVISVGFAESLDSRDRDKLRFLSIPPVSLDIGGPRVVVTHIETQEDHKLRFSPGFDFMKDDECRELIKETSFTGNLAVAGPVTLTEGGGAKSAFIMAQRVDQLDKPSSFIFVLVRIDHILKSLELSESDGQLLVRIRPDKVVQRDSIYEGDQTGVAFSIPASGGKPDFEYDLFVKGTRWKLSMFLANPWQQSNASLLLSTLVFAIVLPLPILLFKRSLLWFGRRAGSYRP